MANCPDAKRRQRLPLWTGHPRCPVRELAHVFPPLHEASWAASSRTGRSSLKISPMGRSLVCNPVPNRRMSPHGPITDKYFSRFFAKYTRIKIKTNTIYTNGGFPSESTLKFTGYVNQVHNLFCSIYFWRFCFTKNEFLTTSISKY